MPDPKTPETLDDYLSWLAGTPERLLEKFTLYDRTGAETLDVAKYAADAQRYRQWLAELATLREKVAKYLLGTAYLPAKLPRPMMIIDEKQLATLRADAELGKHLREVLAGEKTLLDVMIKCNDATAEAKKWREQQARRTESDRWERDVY